MRLNLRCGKNIRHQYLNIDEDSRDLNENQYKQGDISCLDWLCENDTVDEIIAVNAINTVHHTKVKNAIYNWTSKLRILGTLKLGGVDIFNINEKLSLGQVGLEEYSNTVFSDRNKSAVDIEYIIEILEECGMSVETRRFDGILFYIEAKKND